MKKLIAMLLAMLMLCIAFTGAFAEEFAEVINAEAASFTDKAAAEGAIILEVEPEAKEARSNGLFTVSKKSVKVGVGKTKTIKVKFNYDGTVKRRIKDDSIVNAYFTSAYSQNGVSKLVIRGLKKGKTTVTLTNTANKKDKVKIKVTVK